MLPAGVVNFWVTYCTALAVPQHVGARVAMEPVTAPSDLHPGKMETSIHTETPTQVSYS